MSNRNPVAAAPQICSAGPLPPRWLGASVTELLAAAARRFAASRRRRREREELQAFLASDHRAAADIGYGHRPE
jgi:hypothetical protein